jgi:hypothetical protein
MRPSLRDQAQLCGLCAMARTRKTRGASVSAAKRFWTHGCQEEAKEDGMTLKRYFPISVAAFILIIVGAYYTSLPVIPFIVLALFGETLLGFQFEDHKALRFLQTAWKALKSAH